MNSAVTAVRTIQVELPGDAFHFHPWEPRQIADEMRALWFVEQVRERRLGYGKAAELARIPEARFVELMGKHGVSPFDYDAEDLDEEFRP
jgi:predicted HTH domain antitoxin